jgi:hypothetical protein
MRAHRYWPSGRRPSADDGSGSNALPDCAGPSNQLKRAPQLGHTAGNTATPDCRLNKFGPKVFRTAATTPLTAQSIFLLELERSYPWIDSVLLGSL